MASIVVATPIVGSLASERLVGAPRFSDTILLTTSQVAKWSLRLVFVLIVARALGPRAFGTYALLFALTEFLAVASGSGYADYLTREAAKDVWLAWELAFPLALIRVALAVVGTAAEVAILRLLHYPHLVLVGTAWMAFALVPRAFSEAVQGVLRGMRQYAAYLAIEAVLGGTLVLGAVVLLVQTGGLRTAITTEIAAALAAGIAAAAIAWKHQPGKPFFLPGPHLLKTGAVFNLYMLIGSLYDRFDVVLLSKLSGDYGTGLYSVAYRALGMTQILAYGVLYSLLPRLSGNVGSAAERRRMERAMGLLLSAALAVVLATVALAGPAVRWLLGERYAESAAVLTILCWSVPLRYLNYALNVTLLAAGRERVFVRTSLVCLAVNFVGNMVFIPVFGWRAAAAITIATELILLIQNLYWVRRAVGGLALPPGTGRAVMVFLGLYAAAVAGRYGGAPVVVGTACVAAFVAFLYASRMMKEFTAVWGAGD